MADRIKLLDCTLRDGGYINDWNFGHENIIEILKKVLAAGIDMIEIGFLNERRIFDYNRSITPDTKGIEEIFKEVLGEKKAEKSTLILGMVDYGTCGFENICTAKDSYLDGIRVIFKNQNRKEAMEFCRELKNLGYLVFVQLVSVTSYQKKEIEEIAEIANEFYPYAVSIVDTYGLMHQEEVLTYFKWLEDTLDDKIAIGFHGHNNFQMGYANSIRFLEQGVNTKRTLLVDGTLHGMGKGAGNTPIELLAMHLNQNYGKKYHMCELWKGMEKIISLSGDKRQWGYDLHHFLSAYYKCHPEYVMYLAGKNFSMEKMNQILGQLEKEKKLLYDASYIEKLCHKQECLMKE